MLPDVTPGVHPKRSRGASPSRPTVLFVGPYPPPYSGPEDSWETFRPFLLGMVELPGQCRVISRLLVEDESAIAIGMEMELTLFPYTTDKEGVTRMAYAFREI